MRVVNQENRSRICQVKTTLRLLHTEINSCVFLENKHFYEN